MVRTHLTTKSTQNNKNLLKNKKMPRGTAVHKAADLEISTISACLSFFKLRIMGGKKRRKKSTPVNYNTIQWKQHHEGSWSGIDGYSGPMRFAPTPYLRHAIGRGAHVNDRDTPRTAKAHRAIRSKSTANKKPGHFLLTQELGGVRPPRKYFRFFVFSTCDGSSGHRPKLAHRLLQKTGQITYRWHYGLLCGLAMLLAAFAPDYCLTSIETVKIYGAVTNLAFNL